MPRAKKQSLSYWKKRFELIEQSQHQKGAAAFVQIESQYQNAEREIEKQIRSWYQRFADNNNVTIADARKMLDARQLAELKWDINQYIQYGQQNAINGQWVKELENASARFHISRLEALKIQVRQSVEVMFGSQADTLDQTMRVVYKSGYYRTAYEVQRGCGVGWDFATLDDKTISKVINKPWAADGSNFSQRVWKNRQQLVNELNQTLTRNIVLGQDPQKAIDAIAKKMHTSKARAGALVMTEEAFFSSAAQKDCFEELDVEEYEIVATLDSHTSEICQDMDGKVFKMSQWEVGVTAPPFHVRCRTTTVPYFRENFDLGERAAKDSNGKTYHVPADMTYPEWKKKFVDGDPADSDLQEILNGGIVGIDDEVDQAKTIQEARTLLTDKIGFTEIEDSFKKVNDDLAISSVNQLNRLEHKFNAVHDSTHTSICGENSKTAIAYVSSSTVNPSAQSLSLCPKYHKDVNDFIAVQKKGHDSGFKMPCSEDDLQIYTVTHEYGHILQNVLIKKRFETDGWRAADSLAFLDRTKKTWKAQSKWYTERRIAVQNECFDEIIAIAKEQNPDFVLADNLSGYGKTNKAEFFAEVFANSQLSKPNELGKAMNIWLKRKGLMK